MNVWIFIFYLFKHMTQIRGICMRGWGQLSPTFSNKMEFLWVLFFLVFFLFHGFKFHDKIFFFTGDSYMSTLGILSIKLKNCYHPFMKLIKVRVKISARKLELRLPLDQMEKSSWDSKEFSCSAPSHIKNAFTCLSREYHTFRQFITNLLLHFSVK